MSEKSCPKPVPGPVDVPKNTEKLNPAVTFIFLHGIDQTLSSILSQIGAWVLSALIQ